MMPYLPADEPVELPNDARLEMFVMLMAFFGPIQIALGYLYAVGMGVPRQGLEVLLGMDLVPVVAIGLIVVRMHSQQYNPRTLVVRPDSVSGTPSWIAKQHPELGVITLQFGAVTRIRTYWPLGARITVQAKPTKGVWIGLASPVPVIQTFVVTRRNAKLLQQKVSQWKSGQRIDFSSPS